MLTIYLYKNVKFKRNYSDVLLKNNDNQIIDYLSDYLEGTIENVNKFFSNETFIDLPLLYEGCNYMLIQDDRSIIRNKFLFIDNVNFISGTTIRYTITLDVWNTYSNLIELGYSQLITGHIDALTLSPQFLNAKRNLIYLENGEMQLNTTLTKYATKKFNSEINATIIVLASQSNGAHLFLTKINNEENLYTSLQKLSMSRFHTENTTAWVSIKINKVYIINSFDLIYDIQTTYNDTSLNKIVMGDESASSQWYDFDFAGGYGEGEEYTPYYTPVSKFEINSFNMFSDENFESKSLKLKNKYILGTPLTNQEIIIDSETNYKIYLNLYIIQYNQIIIYFEYAQNKINVTNDFEIPFINDDYQLYMSQNQATIDANNKANKVSLTTSLITAGASVALLPMTAGASAMLGINAISNIASYNVNKLKQEASIEDAKKLIDRVDGLYTSGLYTLINGAGLFVYSLKNSNYSNEILNFYGTKFKYYTEHYRALSPSLFNFYFVQYEDVEVNGMFTYDIRKTFEDIFKNGVRIWCDELNFCDNVNYKK